MCTTVITLAGTAMIGSAAIGQMGSSPQASRPATQNSPNSTNPDGTTAMDQNMNGMRASGDQTMMDKMFVHKALEGGMAEVELGQLALTKTNDPDIKAFAQKMVDDHGKMGDDMKMVAEQNGVKVPQRLSKKDEAIKMKLQSLDGAAFDKSYVKDMVKDHEQDEAEFKKESEMASIPAVKDAATKGEMVISMHLDMVKKLAESNGVKSE
jgi:putative membrane protein